MGGTDLCQERSGRSAHDMAGVRACAILRCVAVFLFLEKFPSSTLSTVLLSGTVLSLVAELSGQSIRADEKVALLLTERIRGYVGRVAAQMRSAAEGGTACEAHIRTPHLHSFPLSQGGEERDMSPELNRHSISRTHRFVATILWAVSWCTKKCVSHST
jgi:hypothetical protein